VRGQSPLEVASYHAQKDDCMRIDQSNTPCKVTASLCRIRAISDRWPPPIYDQTSKRTNGSQLANRRMSHLIRMPCQVSPISRRRGSNVGSCRIIDFSNPLMHDLSSLLASNESRSHHKAPTIRPHQFLLVTSMKQGLVNNELDMW